MTTMMRSGQRQRQLHDRPTSQHGFVRDDGPETKTTERLASRGTQNFFSFRSYSGVRTSCSQPTCMAVLYVVQKKQAQDEMIEMLESVNSAADDKRLNAELRAKIYEQTRLIAELRHDEVNRQQTSRARKLTVHSLRSAISCQLVFEERTWATVYRMPTQLELPDNTIAIPTRLETIDRPSPFHVWRPTCGVPRIIQGPHKSAFTCFARCWLVDIYCQYNADTIWMRFDCILYCLQLR